LLFITLFQSHLLTKGRSEPSLETKDGPEDVLPNIAIIIIIVTAGDRVGSVDEDVTPVFRISVTGSIEDVQLRATTDNFITSQLRNLFMGIPSICHLLFNSVYGCVRLLNVTVRC